MAVGLSFTNIVQTYQKHSSKSYVTDNEIMSQIFQQQRGGVWFLKVRSLRWWSMIQLVLHELITASVVTGIWFMADH